MPTLRKRVALSILFSIGLAACESNPLYRGYSVTPLTLDDQYNKLVRQLTIKKSNAAGQTVEVGLVKDECFQPSTKTTDCERQRNQAISALIISSEHACLIHRRSIYGKDAAWNLTLGTMTNLFAGAASVVTLEKHRPIFAALALFSNSERSLVNETVYKQALIQGVDKKIIEMRNAKMQSMHDSLKLTIDKYGMDEALRDVIMFHSSCSFMDGLQKALEEGTQNPGPARLQRLRTALATMNLEYSAFTNSNHPGALKLKERIDAISVILMAEESK